MTPEQASSMAATDNRQYNPHKRGRPPFNTQQSSSVPSTPLQQPRDVRFSSRSPSPTKTLGANSPQSVALEAVGALPAPRLVQPLVCKFEIGAEIKKRRIIYTEGGNEPLPPPKEEPKKTLDPHEDDKLTGDMRELYDRLLPTDESEVRRVQLVQKLEDILNNEWPGNEIKVNVFGSSGNLLSSTDSDVDVCITTTEKKLESMHTLAALLHRHGMEKVICRASAKVPIVKFWDPELQLACDVNVNNPLALENTRMIKTYVQMDDRIRPLAKIIKYWTKQRLLNDAAFGGTISSYTWICMIINFLQTRDPPIVPSLQKIPDHRSTTASGELSAFADDLETLRTYGKDNTESLGQLIFHFFRHYGYHVNYNGYVISVKEGRLLPREEKGWDAKNWAANKEARSSLCVEEPFNTPRNLGNSADDYAWTGIHKEIRRAFDLIKHGENLDKCCEQYEFPPEEKSTTLFQRPTPKLPVLRRSASQTGRGNNAGQARPINNTRNGRNNSSQRSNNRRASSGANFANQRVPYVMSPPLGINPIDYFSTARMSTDQLHDQLYKQYQYLQAQQEALRNQLLQQQQSQAQMHAQVQAQAQAQARSMELGTPPRQHRTSFTNNVTTPQTPRVLDNTPNTAPLLPGSLYHYPARYPPPSPLAQSRTTADQAVTSPSSPSQQHATPSLRRGVHRSSITEGTQSGPRSQSQPGRSYPNPLTLQGLVHPGYDVSGALGTPYMLTRPMHAFPQLQSSSGVRQPNGVLYADTAMPKEYVGYYVGNSPQLLPQYQPGNLTQPSPLHGTPSRSTSRRISPELIPPLLPNGLRHPSRSPSPLGHEPHRSSISSARSGSFSHVPQPPPQQVIPPPRPIESNGPVIVNGSNTGYTSSPRTSTLVGPTIAKSNFGLGVDVPADTLPTEQIRQLSLDTALPYTNGLHHQHAESPRVSNGYSAEPTSAPQSEARPTWQDAREGHSTQYSSSSQAHLDRGERIARARNMPPLNLSPPNGDRGAVPEHASPLNAAGPVLSPVEEARTPSPTVSRGVDFNRPGPHRKLAQAAQVANGKAGSEHSGATKKENQPRGHGPTSSAASNHGRESSQQTPANAWQTAPSRKGHKKNKSSTASGRSNHTPRNGGEAMPANEADRKGG